MDVKECFKGVSKKKKHAIFKKFQGILCLGYFKDVSMKYLKCFKKVLK